MRADEDPVSPAPSSLWMEGPSPRHPAVSADLDVDVCVVGAGVFGATAAVLLARTGARVALVDAWQAGGGVTGHSTAKVTTLHGTVYQEIIDKHGPETASAYALANRHGLETVRDLAREFGIECELREKPAYTYVLDAKQEDTIAAEIAAASGAGLRVSYTDDTPLPYPVAAAVRLDGQSEFHPRRYVLGLVDTLERMGGQVFESTRVVELEQDDRPRVVTESGRVITADEVVIATLMPIFDRGLFFARCTAMRSYAIAARTEDERGIDGMLISADEPTRSIRSAADPDGDGELLVVGGEGHITGEESETHLRYAELERWARSELGATDVVHRWSAHDMQPADGLPYVGQLSLGTPNVWTATGFRKWGFTNGTAAALEVVARIDRAEVPWGDVFDANRVAPVKSARGVAAEVKKDAGHLIGDRLKGAEVDSVEEIAPGAGAIAKVDGEVLAVSKDHDGTLHALSPDCTHMGCRVSWNSAERSWDCPCHGSRFSPDGVVLQGPAVHALEVRHVDAAPRAPAA